MVVRKQSLYYTLWNEFSNFTVLPPSFVNCEIVQNWSPRLRGITSRTGGKPAYLNNTVASSQSTFVCAAKVEIVKVDLTAVVNTSHERQKNNSQLVSLKKSLT